MTDMELHILTRRRLLATGLAAVASAVLAACSRSTPSETPAAGTTATGATSLAPTPACEDGDDPTPAQTEGPYFRPSSPEKSNLRGDVSKGTPLVLTGTVVTTACRPVSRALVDLWHCDADGEYDNTGYRLRGHVFTDAEGRYRFETIVPGIYPGRTRHYHVKVQAANGPVLTTQLYFPGEPENGRDRIYRDECLLDVQGDDATFRFVVQA